jgi:hypothetical protein
VASRGFFDEDNTAPWDTWISYVVEAAPGRDRAAPSSDYWRTYLISWVPPQLIELVDRGLDANPERCIIWADELVSAFASLLQDGRLL